MKRALIITGIIVALGFGFLYMRQQQRIKQGDTQASGFRGFFTFGTRNTSETNTNQGEATSTFTPPEETPSNGQTTPTPTPGTISSPFGSTTPLTPSQATNQQPIISTGTTIGGGTVSTPPFNPNTGGGTSGTGSGTGTGSTQCSDEELQIEFTPEEIARLQALEQRFYAIAGTLRTQDDVQAEKANYSEYKLMNQKYAEMISYCEATTPQLPSAVNKRVATPLYTDQTQNQPFFTQTGSVGGIIDLVNPTTNTQLIEKLFRINIW